MAAHPVDGQQGGCVLGRLDHLADRQQAHLAVAVDDLAGIEPRADLVVGHDRGPRPWGSGWRPGPSRSKAVRSITDISPLEDGAKMVSPGILRHERQVEHAVVARPVVAGDPGPVQGEHHRQAVQADVEVGLVERPAEERRVHRHHGPQPAHGHARGRGDGVALGDAHVEEPVGPAGLEGQQAGRAGHGGGDGHDLGEILPDARASPR